MKKKENSSEEEKRVTNTKDSKAVVLEGKIKKSKNKKDDENDDENDDPQLQEFLQVMQHRSRSKLWANDTLAAPSLEQSKIASEDKIQMTKGHEENLDGEDADLEGIRGEGTVLSGKQQADKPNDLVHDEVISDMDYFRSRIKNKWSDSESSDDDGNVDGSEHGDGDDNDDSSDSQNKSNHCPVHGTLEFDDSRGEAEEGSSGECGINNSADALSSPENKNEEVLESGRLFIRNLPYTATYVPFNLGPLCLLFFSLSLQ